MGDLNASRLCTDAAEFLGMHYMQRQLIVVADDEVIWTERKARGDAIQAAANKQEAQRLETLRKQSERDQSAKGKSGWRAVASRIHMPEVDIDVTSLPILEGVLDALSNDDKIDVLMIGDTVASTLAFPAGHPRLGVLYVGHPTLPRIYYTTANFHRLTFDHKFSEAIKLLMSLGATSVTVERVSGWSRAVAVKASAPLGIIKGDGGSKHETNSRILFEAELNGANEPALPPDLVWYPYEPTWQAIADGRLKYGIKNFKLEIEYTDDFNINSELSAKVRNVGLDLGGKFTNFEATVWNMSGEFPD